MKIAVLAGSNQNIYASALIQKLVQDGYPPTCVVIRKGDLFSRIVRGLKKHSLLDLYNRIRRVRKKGTVSTANLPLEEFMLTNNLSRETIQELSGRLGFNVLFFDKVNDKRLIHSLAQQRPDLIIYCSGGILRRPLLEIPEIGTLNAHMGLLPEFRGMNVLEWSLFYKVPVGVTVHFIDAGIDTGDIILQQTMSIESTDTISSLRMKSIVMNIVLMAEAVQLISHGNVTKHPNPVSEGKQYFVMHDLLKRKAEKNLMHIKSDPMLKLTKP